MTSIVSNLGSIHVFINDDSYPVYRKTVPKRWHDRRGYAMRVNKKWRKRFGVIGRDMVIPNGQIIGNPSGLLGKRLFMNSTTFADIKRRLSQ